MSSVLLLESNRNYAVVSIITLCLSFESFRLDSVFNSVYVVSIDYNCIFVRLLLDETMSASAFGINRLLISHKPPGAVIHITVQMTQNDLQSEND